MLWWWTSLVAAAAPCPDVEILVEQAGAAFDEAEVELARARLAVAVESLPCQSKTVPRQTLLDLYHLDALASVAAEDPKAALYAIIRAVTLDPGSAPPPDVGPELLEQHRQWADRLRGDALLVSATTSEVALWIDGVAVGAEPVRVVVGEHLVQVRDAGGWRSGLVTLIDGPAPGAWPLQVRRPPAAPQTVGPPPPPPPPPAPERRRHVALGVGIGIGLAGAALVAAGGLAERRFHAQTYDDPTYGGCARGESCWAEARADRIAADARAANALYLSGYAASGLGIGLVGADVLVSTSGAGVRLRGVFR